MDILNGLDNILKLTQVTGFIVASFMLPYFFWVVGPTPGISMVGGFSVGTIPLSDILPWMILSIYGMHVRGSINIIIDFIKARKQ